MMIREKFKWRPHKNESTDAQHRGGVTRSSEEVFVTVDVNEVVTFNLKKSP